MSLPTAYRGRFAPTPSGPLHLGSLVTAVASWLAARKAGGQWLLRIDDLDRPRCVPGAVDMIQRQLEAHGLVWDGAPVFQTSHEDEYRAALQLLQSQGDTYICRCTRAVLATQSRAGPDGPVYAGTCRDSGLRPGDGAVRFRAEAQRLQWWDGLGGRVQRSIPQRADGQIAYQLACVVDEQRMGITEVVRGDDLLSSTVQQLLLIDRLGFARPAYAHVRVLSGPDGRKLSKQNGAAALLLDTASVRDQLFGALQALGLSPTAALQQQAVDEMLRWALTQWPQSPPPAPA